MHCSLARAGLRFSADPEVLIVNWRRAGSMSTANQVKCLSAQYRVMRKAAASDCSLSHSRVIADRLWDIAAGAGAYLDWETADAAGKLAIELGGIPRSQSNLFRALCRLGPRFALRAREGLIRVAKPWCRVAYP